jgi:hypothetical protein
LLQTQTGSRTLEDIHTAYQRTLQIYYEKVSFREDIQKSPLFAVLAGITAASASKDTKLLGLLKYRKANLGEVNMFCPKCGANAQNAESYCTRCGEWLPDLNALTRTGLFRKRTREEKIRKMRILEGISAGLALAAAAMIFAVRRGSGDPELLFLSLLCCLIIAAYQIVNFYLGSTMQKRIEQSRLEAETLSHKGAEQLRSGESTTFVNPQSVVENTTRHLDAMPRKVKR